MFKIQALVDFVVHILNAIYGVVGNYGIAIIIVTILMRIIVFPLTLKQEKSMKKMRDLQPEIEKIKEKYIVCEDNKRHGNGPAKYIKLEGFKGSIVPAENKYWLFDVNGTMSPVGAKEVILKAGDVIDWKLNKLQ